MKKLIYVFLAAAMLLTGCEDGSGEIGGSGQASDTAVTAAAPTEKSADKTEASASEAEISSDIQEKPSEEEAPETAQEAAQDTNTEPAAEEAELTEEAAATESGGAKVNPDGSIDLPIIPVD